MMEKELLRVLVAEDEPIILRYVAGKIEALPGFQVVFTAENGTLALEWLKESPADILVTDIEMPGLGGLDLTERTRTLWPETEIVIVSGYSNFAYAQRALRYGVFDYLLKPIDEAALARALHSVGEKVEENKRLEELRGQLAQRDTAMGLETGDGTDIALQIENYIAACFNKPLTIAGLSAQFNYTPSYINRVFKKKYTISPIQYQIGLRMQRAKELLRSYPNADVKDIAAAVGYDDPRYFSRVFKQIEGVAPSDFAQSM